ncbi:MAG: ATP-dependent DNA helicase RecG [Caldilineaceae bacterium]
MAAPAFERLQKILDLEEKQAWRNRAVVGGMQAMAERWRDDARKENADPQIVTAIVQMMNQYDPLETEARQQCVNDMRRALAGDLSGLPAPTVDAAELDADEAEAGEQFAEDDAENVNFEVAEALFDEADEPADFEILDIGPPEPTDKAQERAAQRRRAQENGDKNARQPEPVKRSPRDLQAPVTILPGVGGVTAEQLGRLGVHQVIDLLWHLPARHEDFSTMRTIAQLKPGEQVTVLANLWEIRERKIGLNRQMVQGILADGTGTLHATWWNKYVVRQLETGKTMRFSGKVGLYMGQKTLDNPSFEELDDEMVATGRLAPVYPLTEGLSNKRLRNLTKLVLDEFSRFLTDPIPSALRKKYNLTHLSAALRQFHFPGNADQLEEARKRLAFADFLYIQLGVLRRRYEMQSEAAPALATDDALLERFQSALAFELTGAQQRVIGEILADIARTAPMTRLVQGDVGSGKTAVAAAAMYGAVHNGAQSVLLAPTQILAEQHHRGISNLLGQLTRPDGAPLRVALLTGRVTGSERADVLSGLREGTIDVAVGTTALIQESVLFQNLALVVVDEQHRFGVEQRGALRNQQGLRPHLLVMSATPIPRSLALTIYGDLDLSIIDEMPPGRTPIKTKWFMPTERERLYSFLRREVAAGRQGFIVYPLVEESEKLDAGAAVEEYERLRTEIFPNERLALLHGRMSGNEKDEVMSAFGAGDYDVLVSTSVIEVGIDVPNASLMIIEDAERFGLAQLHQFRGRVGRGLHPGYCALVSKANGADAQERLIALEESTDGFVLAEKDLELRGPGDFFGTRQSGLPELRAATLGDLETLALAREAAQELFAEDPELTQHTQLARQVERFWRGHGDVN